MITQHIPSLEFTTQSPEQVITKFNSSLKNGLTAQEATARITEYGLNQLPEETLSWVPILQRQFY